MTNFKLDISYDGTDFFGWQIQKDKRTVQGDILNAFKIILSDENFNLIGSGRTDSGVHANHQIANIKLQTKMKALNIKRALNANTYKDIYINSCAIIDENFNARFSAKKRRYIYKINKEYMPVNRKYSYFYKDEIDLDKLQECTKVINGEHDFSSFCKESSLKENNKCIVFKSFWKEVSSKEICFIIEANRFLHHMVRYLVGTMLDVSKGKVTITKFKDKFYEKKISNTIIKSPAHGLYLDRIFYD